MKVHEQIWSALEQEEKEGFIADVIEFDHEGRYQALGTWYPDRESAKAWAFEQFQRMGNSRKAATLYEAKVAAEQEVSWKAERRGLRSLGLAKHDVW